MYESVCTHGIYVSACSCELMHVEVRGQSGCSLRLFSILFVYKGMFVPWGTSGGHRTTFGSWFLPSTLFEAGFSCFCCYTVYSRGFSHLCLPSH